MLLAMAIGLGEGNESHGHRITVLLYQHVTLDWPACWCSAAQDMMSAAPLRGAQEGPI